MEELSILEENWNVIINLLPGNWKELARIEGAVIRKPKTYKNLEDLLRMFFIHAAQGYSLRETVARAKLSNIASMSDVGLLKNLKKSENWLKKMCLSLLEESGVNPISNTKGKRIRLFDGSYIKEAGKTGSTWALHYSINLANLNCDHFEITPRKGQGNGETLCRYPILKNDCILADRGYSTNKDIAYVDKKSAYSVIRVHSTALVMESENNERIDLLSEVKPLSKTDMSKELNVLIKDESHIVKGRLCILRKSEYGIKQTIKKLKRQASRNGTKLQERTIELGKYVILFTSLPKDEWHLEEIFKIYKTRWQIELSFKRLKSLVKLGHLPKYNAESSKAWLYSKLLVGLLIEKLMRFSSAFSPWGYPI